MSKVKLIIEIELDEQHVRDTVRVVAQHTRDIRTHMFVDVHYWDKVTKSYVDTSKSDGGPAAGSA